MAGIRWRRRIWASIGLFGLLAGVLLAIFVPPPPTAVTRLLIIHENDQGSVGESLLETDVALLETTRIAAAALERINSDEPPKDFLTDYLGEALTGNVLELTVHGASDRDAVARAQALADVFIADHLQRTEAAANAEATALLDRRARAEDELRGVDDSIATTMAGNSTAGLDQLYARRAELTSQIQQLGQQAEEAQIGAPRVAAGTQIVDSPRAITGSPLVTGALYAAVGLILGFGVGLALATVVSVVQDRPVLRRDIAAHLGASVIAQLPAPRRGPARLWRGSRGVTERRRLAATLVRVVGDGPLAVSLLELGCPRTAAELALTIAEELATGGPVVLVDDLPGRHLHRLAGQAGSSISVLDSAEYPAECPADRPAPAPRERHLGVGSVRPGAAWTDLGRLGSETLLVVRAGHADAPWLHTVARQLAAARIPVLGVVLVHPDPRDRSDGTLWDALHTTLRGPATRRAGSPPPDGRPAVNLPATGSTTPRIVEVP